MKFVIQQMTEFGYAVVLYGDEGLVTMLRIQLFEANTSCGGGGGRERHVTCIL